MSLTFSNSELRITSKDVLDTKQEIVTLGLQSTAATSAQLEAKEKDDSNKKFYNNYKNIIHQYNYERNNLIGLLLSEYSDATLLDAAKQVPNNPHFPTSPLWMNFPPKLLAVNNGSPSTNNADYELLRVNNCQSYIDILYNGFNDGPFTTSCTSGFTGNVISVTSVSGFSVNDRVLFTSATGFVYGTISNISGLNLTITVISGATYSIITGSSVTNTFGGFTLSQIENGNGGSTALTLFMASLKVLIDSNVTAWKTYLQNNIPYLTANDAIDDVFPEATDTAAMLATIQPHLNTIATWKTFPSTGVGTCRFGTNLPPLNASLALRVTEINNRVNQINTYLGSVTQNPVDGTTTGTGNLFHFWKWIDLRIAKGTGSLSKYYSFELTNTFINAITINANIKDAEYADIMSVYKLTENPSANFVKLPTVSGLAVNDQVSVLDDNKLNPVFHTTILAIQDLTVTLNNVISLLTTASSARLVKLLGAAAVPPPVPPVFPNGGRAGVIAPASILASGSSTSKLYLQKSFGNSIDLLPEGEKYSELLGFRFKVRSEDYSFSEETTILSLNTSEPDTVNIDPPLSTAPPSGYILEIADYSSSINPSDQALVKSKYAFFNNEVTVVSGISITQFTLSPADIATIHVGMAVVVNNADYTLQSPETKIEDITGNVVTVFISLGFIPTPGCKVELLGFPDGGKPYKFS